MVKGSGVEAAVALVREIVDMLNGPGDADSHATSAERLALLDTVRRFPARLKCAMLPWLTLRAALNDEAEAVSVS
jgi:nitrogen fixation NifU-like protein